ncbi:MAG TPA: chemoreceptor glutamine deamidase CheD [Steroidobacteraceae bacterium]|nr:chemoreceptor glutamine deamidase CheD [Steroidobacteraceae bacterium]
MSTDETRLPPALPQFAHIRRYWDPSNGVFAAKLLPGEYYVTHRGEMVCTVLGSCVSACVRDRVLGVGGMNHFMLPLDGSPGPSAWDSGASAATRYGNVAMERLINDILKCGGRRENLEFKVVGGGRVVDSKTDIGARNIEFVRQFLRIEGFAILGEDVGDQYPRKVHYFPTTGKVRVRKLVKLHNSTLFDREKTYLQDLKFIAPRAGEVELFR